ncbi:hypothetical protein GOODEAATRI_024445 [Goodea atripinnis]|uniref:Germ cell-specific gene 1-like protein n=1 Tax=Goodea atripinnis TaxID=208336 RepID=A0ABV0MKF7_9TELE
MGIDRRRRASLALTLNFLALFLAVSALTTSYWCEGMRKVVKPFCTGPVTSKQAFCIMFNSSNINDSRVVQYIWETGEDKYLMRKFHTGIWFSCEQNINMSGKFHCTPLDPPDWKSDCARRAVQFLYYCRYTCQKPKQPHSNFILFQFHFRATQSLTLLPLLALVQSHNQASCSSTAP